QRLGSRLGESGGPVEAPEPLEERLVADQSAKHVEDGCGLVVDDGAEDPAVAADVTQAIAERNRPLIRLLHAPPPELAQEGREGLVAAAVARVERREVLREPLAQPLLVVVAPADGLPPPLVGDFVREEELGEVLER